MHARAFQSDRNPIMHVNWKVLHREIEREYLMMLSYLKIAAAYDWLYAVRALQMTETWSLLKKSLQKIDIDGWNAEDL